MLWAEGQQEAQTQYTLLFYDICLLYCQLYVVAAVFLALLTKTATFSH